MELKNWLRSHGVTQVVMESTGVYWIPVWNVLEYDFELLLRYPFRFIDSDWERLFQELRADSTAGCGSSLNWPDTTCHLGGNYAVVRATYRSPETVVGSSNSTNDSASVGSPGMDGLIQIQPGERIPLIPQHLLKAFASGGSPSRDACSVMLFPQRRARWFNCFNDGAYQEENREK